MKALPARSGFGETYAAGKPQVVWTTLVSDLETPVSAMIKLADGQSNCFLLESVTGGEVRGRYSFIGLKPDLIWRCNRDKVEINRRARVDAHAFEPSDERPARGGPAGWTTGRGPAAPGFALAAGGKPNRPAGGTAADGRWPVRLSRL